MFRVLSLYIAMRTIHVSIVVFSSGGGVLQGMSPEEAFKQSSESITGPITKGISKGGILKLYEGLDKAGQDEFKARDTQAPGVGTGRAGSIWGH